MGGLPKRCMLGLLIAAAILLLPNVDAQLTGCSNTIDFSHTTTPGSTAIWPITWVPDCTPELRFAVKMDTADGVAKILLSSDTTPNKPYFIIQLGWNDDQNAPGDSTELVYSYLFLCLASDSDCDDTATKSVITSNGDVSEDGYVDFVLSTTSDGIHVAYDGEQPFLSLNNLDTTLFDPNSIRFVGLMSHDGTNGMTDENSDWRFCTDDWQSLATGADAVAETCADPSTDCGDRAIDGGINSAFTANECFTTMSTSNPSYLEIDLGEEKHVVGVTIYNAVDGGGATATDLQDAGVFVGSCEAGTLTLAEIQKNVMCSSKVSAAAAATGEPPVYKACPTNTYGQYVYIADTSGSAGALVMCEVVVHGKEIADADKTKIQFASETSTYMEEPDTEDDVTESRPLTLERTGSAGTFTCSSIAITLLSTGNADPGATDDFSFNSNEADVPVTFETGDITKDTAEVLEFRADCESESDETIVFGLTSEVGAQIGSPSKHTVTIVDDDPKYKFSASEAEVWENEEKITLTVERSDYTTAETTIHIDTIDCGEAASRATSDGDYRSELNTPVTFEAGEVEATVDIYIINDDGNVDYENEQFCVELDKSESDQGEEVTPNSIEVTIKNDDTIYLPCVVPDNVFQGVENEEEILVQICRDGKTDTAGCIDVYSEPMSGDNPALVGADYDYPTFTRRTLYFAGSQKSVPVKVPINNDKLVESDEKFKLTLALPTIECGDDLSPVVKSDAQYAELEIVDDDSLYSVVSLTNQIPENQNSVTITFERTSSARSGTITVEVSGGEDRDANIGTSTATEDLDFMQDGEHTVEFETGQTTAMLTIPIVDDPYLELNEVFYVEITDSDGEINMGRKRTEVYINNDDAFWSIQQVERTVLEGIGEFHVLVQRGPLVVNGVTMLPYLGNDVTITVNTNSEITGASAGSDFETVSKTLTFYGATRDTVKACPVEIINDEVVEGQEEFYITISNDNVQIDPDFGRATITIEDDDGRITCSVDGETRVDIEEDEDSITVTCTRDGIVNDDGDDQSLNRIATFVMTAVAESARQGEDFNSYSATWQFPANVATIRETIDDLIIDDDAAENEETFRLQITDSDSEIDTSSSVITVTILDNDVELFGFEEIQYNVGESCSELRVVVKRTSGSGAGSSGTTLRLSASNGAGSNGAVYPDDYQTNEAIIQFLGSQQQEIVTIDIVRDSVDEGPESFTLTLSKVSGSGEVDQSAAVATVTIEDQTVIYSVQDTQITRSESSGTQRVYFVRSGDFCQADEIYVATRDGTARAREDFIGFSNLRVYFEGASDTAYVDLTILDDSAEEPTEIFTVEIQSTDIQIGTGTTTVTIEDDDGRVFFRENTKTVVEGSGTVTLTIDRVGNAITPSIVRVQTARSSGSSTAATEGSDYIPLNSVFIEFGESEASKSFSVSIVDDDEEEDDETFVVEIVDTTDGVVSHPSEVVVTIEDDDEPSGPGLSTGAIIGIAGGVGGAVLLLVLGVGCLVMNAARPGPAAAAAVGARPPPIAYNGRTSNYPQSYRYGPDYRRPQRAVYYR